METLPKEKQVIELISKLKKSSGAYPKDMLYSRRQQFIRQVASAGLGMEIGRETKSVAQQSQGAGTSVATTAASKILETILVAAIVVEAGVASYTYRNKIANFFRSLRETTGTSEPLQQPNNDTSPLPKILPTLTPPATSSTPSTATSIYTPVPPSQLNNNGNTGVGETNVEATSTPSDNNGNHYGQTPVPGQTKDENDTNNDTNNNNKGNK